LAFMKNEAFIESDSLSFGSIFHKAMLEKELYQRNKGHYLELLKKAERDHFQEMLKSAEKHPILQSVISDAQFKEKSIFTDFNGVPVKARIDLYTKKKWLVDFKTSRDIKFSWHHDPKVRKENQRKNLLSLINKYRYDLQAAFYKKALERIGHCVKGVVYIIFSKNPPYKITLCHIGKGLLERGEKGDEFYTGFSHLLKENLLPPASDRIISVDL